MPVPLWIDWLPKSMKHSPSWNFNSLSGSRETSAFHATWMFITVLTTPHHLSLPLAKLIQSTPYSTPFTFVTTLSCHLCLGLPSHPFPSSLHTKILYAIISPLTCHMLCPLHSPWLYHQNKVLEGIQIMKLLTTKFSRILLLCPS
jgi:hypothetical protein